MLLTLSHLSGRVSARRASGLLNVVRALSTSSAHSVRLVVALAKALSSLSLYKVILEESLQPHVY